MLTRRLPGALTFALAIVLASRAHAFDRIQPPEIAVGQRATLGGSLSGLAFGPADVSRGGFSLPLSLATPGERGDLLVPFAPTYNPDNGISPWGLGFASSLAITRIHVAGSLAYDFAKGDQLASPFGRLVQGADGAWVPVGLDRPVRVIASGSDLVAYLPDGSTWTFGGSASSIGNSRGTYAWYVRQARDPRGRTTTLTWTKGKGGQPFLSQISYGGTDGGQYQVALAYEPITTTDANGAALPRFVDYRSGAPIALDQRVTTVTMRAKSRATGQYVERWHYTLSYVEDVVGAAFYLARVDRTFASGEAAPSVTYGYSLKGDGIQSRPLTELPQLSSLFLQLKVGDDVVQPQGASVADTNFDGNADLEVADNDRTTVLQGGSGTADDPLHYDIAIQPPPSAACTGTGDLGCYEQRCRPMKLQGADVLAPRLLAEVDPTNGDLEVVDFLYSAPTDTTRVTVCSRAGNRLGLADVPSNWEQSDLTRLVDLDNDHFPDLVRVYAGGFDVLPNQGSLASPNAWGAITSGTLLDPYGNAFQPTALWISDIGGDGYPDLIGQIGGALEVWHGLGNFKFQQTSQEFLFKARDGSYLSDLSTLKLVPADLNKDGLQDYFITNSDPTGARFVSYFTNVGAELVETPIDSLDAISPTASPPVIGTFDASGDTGVTITDQGTAYTVKLDGPDSGLMLWADDGEGSVAHFTYARGPATPGVRHRMALLTAMDIDSSGYDRASYDYRYAAPVLHSTGRFLVGFDQVTEREGDLPASPLGVHARTFWNDDDSSGLLTSSQDQDARLPGLVKIEQRTYTPATWDGVPFRQLTQALAGWASADGTRSAVDTTSYGAYAVPGCATHVTRTTSRGTLTTDTTIATLPALAGSAQCMPSDIVTTGKHADSSLDFREEESIERNAIGQPTKLATLGSAGPLVAQSLAYDADYAVASIAEAGKGTTTFAYEPLTKVLTRVTAPDGVTTLIAARDPATDAITDRQTNHGALALHQLARFDGQERLAAEWSSIDGSSATNPSQSYAYQYAGTNVPASILVTSLIDAAAQSHAQTADLLTAKNEKLATARSTGDSWVFDRFFARSRRTDVADQFLIPSQPASASPATLDFATLLGAAPTKVAEATGSTFGLDVATVAELHADVEKKTAAGLGIDPSGVVSRVDTVNGGFATTTLLDPSLKVKLAFTDAAGTRWGYLYDANDRLRAVVLPDGTLHRVDFDEYGRETLVRRPGIASFATTYVPTADGGTTDLVATTITSSAPAVGPGQGMLETLFAYDAAGRKTSEIHRDLVTNASKTFTFFYDGATPTAPAAAGANGFLTGVQGDGYAKTFLYRADGKPVERAITLVGWRTVVTDLGYREDGSVRDRTVTVRDASGGALSSTVHHDDVDANGRLSDSTLNGASLATYAYDALGRPSAARFANGDSVAFSYDAFTRDWVGLTTTRAAGGWSGTATAQFKHDSRGFIGQELLGVGAGTVRRTYGYSDQGFLTSAADGSP